MLITLPNGQRATVLLYLPSGRAVAVTLAGRYHLVTLAPPPRTRRAV